MGRQGRDVGKREGRRRRVGRERRKYGEGEREEEDEDDDEDEDETESTGKRNDGSGEQGSVSIE